MLNYEILKKFPFHQQEAPKKWLRNPKNDEKVQSFLEKVVSGSQIGSGNYQVHSNNIAY